MTWLANSWFPTAVYLLCFLTSTLCAGLLLRSYWRVRSRMLFWTSLCFTMLAINNLVVILDMLVVLDRNLVLYRLVPSLIGVTALLYGFITQESEA